MKKKNLSTSLQNLIGVCLMVALTIFTVSFGMAIKKNSEESHSKNLKISVLIDEVGELRDALDIKESEIADMYGKVSQANEQIGHIHSKIETAVERNSADWHQIKSDLNTSNEQLTVLLKEKEKIISDLAISNQNLQREISVPKHDPSILDVLVIGHNAKLTDTMMIASINPNTQKATLISIPRDLYHKGRKINELYSKYGVGELQKALSEITGIYPEKYVIFNFESFVDLVDMIGGVNITVEKNLIDNAYPGPNNSYTVVKFPAGTYQMDGNKALKYARSRKSTNDFDRAKRQQQVIHAVVERVKELNMLARLDLATKIYGKLQNNVQTNINLFEGLSYLQHYQNYEINGNNVISTENHLYSTRNSRGQYVLLPRGKTYANIKEYVSGLVN